MKRQESWPRPIAQHVRRQHQASAPNVQIRQRWRRWQTCNKSLRLMKRLRLPLIRPWRTGLNLKGRLRSMRESSVKPKNVKQRRTQQSFSDLSKLRLTLQIEEELSLMLIGASNNGTSNCTMETLEHNERFS